MEKITRKITLSVVQKIKPDQMIRDTEIKGFGIRKRKGGASYFLQTRVNGRLRWMTIGLHGSPWNPTSARKEALRLLADIASGIDPNFERQLKREIPSLKEVASEFLEDHGKKLTKNTLYTYELLLKNDIIPNLSLRDSL